MATKLPRVWKHVLGLQTLNNNKQMELNFDKDEPMTYLQQNGLDTYDRHMDFIPHQLRVMTVSLWGIPLEMLETSVDEDVQRFGQIKQRYKSKKNMVKSSEHRSTGVLHHTEETDTGTPNLRRI